ncbi:MAG: type II toxin-antitoxin system prevent-host-death family antitoxin [Polyangiaceae bacterium]|nr:type II toxin-antitoxin system prevent-host-death family antitoxin [Polyangiaceae bacterium]
MSRTLGIREVKARFSHYVELVRAEGEIIITDRGKPVARLSGLRETPSRSLEEVLQEMADTGLIDLGSPRPAEPVLEKARAGVSVSKVVREMRR